MSDRNDDWREARSLRDAARETEEPARAARIRAEDDADTKARQDEAEAGLRAAEEALGDGESSLRRTGSELHQRERELERTGDLTREVEEGARELRADTRRIAEQAREIPDVDEKPRGDR